MHLTLFFTRGVGLHTWAQLGMLEREVALYQGLVQRGVRVSFVTHGLAQDLDYQAQLSPIQILCNRKGRSPERYESWLRWLFAPTLSRTHLIKTNQLEGADVAWRAARFWRKPLLARAGYMWSEFLSRQHGEDSPQARHALAIESQVFQAARAIALTTPMMRDDVIKRLPQTANRIHLIPNFVETERFKPLASPKQVDLIFIGRLQPQKNLEALLSALEDHTATLWIVGSGPLESTLKERYGDLGGRVRWWGNLPHSQLPALLNEARAFILPSLYEGHPKTLIEAMACGLPVIGAHSPGIQEVLTHQQTGYLCPPTPQSLREAIDTVLGQPILQAQLGQSARQFALDHYSLAHIIELEYQLVRDVAGFPQRMPLASHPN